MSSLVKRMAYDAAEPFERLGTHFLRKGALIIFGVASLLVSGLFHDHSEQFSS
jgi:hypothetical protein